MHGLTRAPSELLTVSDKSQPPLQTGNAPSLNMGVVTYSDPPLSCSLHHVIFLC